MNKAFDNYGIGLYRVGGRWDTFVLYFLVPFGNKQRTFEDLLNRIQDSHRTLLIV